MLFLLHAEKNNNKPLQFKTKAQQIKEFFFALFIINEMSCPLLAPCPFQVLAETLYNQVI